MTSISDTVFIGQYGGACQAFFTSEFPYRDIDDAIEAWPQVVEGDVCFLPSPGTSTDKGCDKGGDSCKTGGCGTKGGDKGRRPEYPDEEPEYSDRFPDKLKAQRGGHQEAAPRSAKQAYDHRILRAEQDLVVPTSTETITTERNRVLVIRILDSGIYHLRLGSYSNVIFDSDGVSPLPVLAFYMGQPEDGGPTPVRLNNVEFGNVAVLPIHGANTAADLDAADVPVFLVEGGVVRFRPGSRWRYSTDGGVESQEMMARTYMEEGLLLAPNPMATRATSGQAVQRPRIGDRVTSARGGVVSPYPLMATHTLTATGDDSELSESRYRPIPRGNLMAPPVAAATSGNGLLGAPLGRGRDHHGRGHKDTAADIWRRQGAVTVGPASGALPGLVMIRVAAGAVLDVDTVMQFQVRGYPVTLIENNGFTDTTIPDAIIDSGKLIVNKGTGSSLRTHRRPSNYSQVAKITIGDPNGSSIIYTENYNVVLMEPLIDIRTGLSTSGFQASYPLDPRNKLPRDPATGQWVVPATGQRVDPTTGRALDPNTGLPSGPILVDPVSGAFVAGVTNQLFVIETPLYMTQGGNLGLVTDSPAYPTGLSSGDPWTLPPLTINNETMPLCLITIMDGEVRNMSGDPCASSCGPCFTGSAMSLVALSNTTAYTASGTSLVHVAITGQNMSGHATGPLLVTDGYSSVVDNGSTFSIPLVITSDYMHTRCDGTDFYLDGSQRSDGPGPGKQRGPYQREPHPLTVVLPGESSWNGRILNYKNIGKEVVLIETMKHKIDGSKKIGKVLALQPGEALTLKNKSGRYYIWSRYRPALTPGFPC